MRNHLLIVVLIVTMTSQFGILVSSLDLHDKSGANPGVLEDTENQEEGGEEVVEKQPASGRNPQTGKEIKIAALESEIAGQIAEFLGQ